MDRDNGMILPPVRGQRDSLLTEETDSCGSSRKRRSANISSVIVGAEYGFEVYDCTKDCYVVDFEEVNQSEKRLKRDALQLAECNSRSSIDKVSEPSGSRDYGQSHPPVCQVVAQLVQVVDTVQFPTNAEVDVSVLICELLDRKRKFEQRETETFYSLLYRPRDLTRDGDVESNPGPPKVKVEFKHRDDLKNCKCYACVVKAGNNKSSKEKKVYKQNGGPSINKAVQAELVDLSAQARASKDTVKEFKTDVMDLKSQLRAKDIEIKTMEKVVKKYQHLEALKPDYLKYEGKYIVDAVKPERKSATRLRRFVFFVVFSLVLYMNVCIDDWYHTSRVCLETSVVNGSYTEPVVCHYREVDVQDLLPSPDRIVYAKINVGERDECWAYNQESGESTPTSMYRCLYGKNIVDPVTFRSVQDGTYYQRHATSQKSSEYVCTEPLTFFTYATINECTNTYKPSSGYSLILTLFYVLFVLAFHWRRRLEGFKVFVNSVSVQGSLDRRADMMGQTELKHGGVLANVKVTSYRFSFLWGQKRKNDRMIVDLELLTQLATPKNQHIAESFDQAAKRIDACLSNYHGVNIDRLSMLDHEYISQQTAVVACLVKAEQDYKLRHVNPFSKNFHRPSWI